MSTALVQQVAEAIARSQNVPFAGARQTKIADAVIPLILDAVKEAVQEVVDERGFTESTDYDIFLAIDVVGVMDAIDKLRTKP